MYALVTLAIASFLFLSEGGQAKAQTVDSEKHIRSNVNASNQIPPVVNHLSSDNAQREKAEKDSRAAQDQPRSWGLTRAEGVQNCIALLLAVITAIYVGITGRMFGAIKEQATIMQKQVDNAAEQVAAMREAGMQTAELIVAAKKNADAAKASAEAIVASERAWVMVELASPDLIISEAGHVCRENSLQRHGQVKDSRDPSTPARSPGSFAVGQDDRWWRSPNQLLASK